MVASILGVVITVHCIATLVSGEPVLRKHERENVFVDDGVKIGLSFVMLLALADIGTLLD